MMALSADAIKSRALAAALACCCFATAYSQETEKLQSCAILDFMPENGLSREKVSLLTSRFAAEIRKTGKYKVLSTYRTQQILKAKGFRLSDYEKLPVAALAAGRLLNTDKIICGQITNTGERYTLTTSLIDVDSRRIIKSVRSSFSGYFSDFIQRVPASNIKALLKLAIPPVTQPQAQSGPPTKKRKASRSIDIDRNHGIAAYDKRTWETVAKNNLDQFGEFIEDRIEVGTRLTSYWLVDAKDDSFLGSIDWLNSKQNYLPNKFFIDWLMTPKWGLELTWDRIEAETLTSYDGHNDGNITASGPIVTFFGRHRFEFGPREDATTLIPSGGIGLAFMRTDFDDEDWWHHGFDGETWQDAQQSYLEWKEAGSPDWPNGGKRRNMSLDNAVGLVLTAGLSSKFHDNLALDLYFRYMSLKIKDTYTITRYEETILKRTTHLPLSNYAIGFGLRYAF